MDLELNFQAFAELLEESKVIYPKKLDLYYEKCSFLINVVFSLKNLQQFFRFDSRRKNLIKKLICK